MANGFTEYLRQTRGELRHVAWPTRLQTIVYASLVAAISIGVALYLGLFDFLFTTGLKRLLDVLPQHPPAQVEATVSTTTAATPTNNTQPTTKPVTLPLIPSQ